MKRPSPETVGIPEILLELPERTLRLVIRAIVEAHPDSEHRTNEARISAATSILLGRKASRGAAKRNRDELLEHLAFDYSVEVIEKRRAVSITSLAKRLVEHYPMTKDQEGKDSIVRDLERKFNLHYEQLLRDHAFNSESRGPFMAVRSILETLEKVGLRVERSVVPPGYWHGDNSDN